MSAKKTSSRNPFALSTQQIRGRITNLQQALTMAKTQAECLVDELGTSVAEDFAEGIIESASEALAHATAIKCALRIKRRNRENTTTVDFTEVKVRLGNLVDAAVPCAGDKNHLVRSDYVKQARATIERLKKGGA